MPKIKIKEKELIELYEQLKEKTKKFTEINPEILADNPKNIVVFRFLIGMSLVSFGNFLNKTYATISQYERGNIKLIPRDESIRMLKLIKEELPNNITIIDILSNFRKYKELSNGGGIQAFIAAEKAKPTMQEQEIRNFLEKNSIVYEANKTFETSIGLLNFDFWIPNKRIVIECTESVYKEMAESLGFRIIKLKDKMRCIGVAILKQNVSKGVIRRLVDYDHIIFSSQLNDLRSLLE